MAMFNGNPQNSLMNIGTPIISISQVVKGDLLDLLMAVSFQALTEAPLEGRKWWGEFKESSFMLLTLLSFNLMPFTLLFLSSHSLESL